MDEDGERLRDDVSEKLGAFHCIELDEVGNWCQGPVCSKVINIKEVKVVRRLESLSVLSCYEIEAEKDDEGMSSVLGAAKDQAEKAYESETTVMRLAEDEEESGGKDEGICDVCLGSVIIGESCVCSVELFGGPRGQEQDAGGLAAGQFREQNAGCLAAGQMREKVDCMYNIMTEKEGDYLYLEVGTSVLKEWSDVSSADEAWERLGIGVIVLPPASDQERTLTDEAPLTSEPLTSEPKTSEPKTLDQDFWMDGELQPDRRESFEVMALDLGTPELDGEFQAVFENTLGFPTARRPIDSLRRMDRHTPDETIHDWFVGCQVSVGSRLSGQHRKQAERLIWTWRDRFCNSIVDLPATDLIAHRIPTIRCKPVRIKNALFTQKEVEWQRKHLPDMLSAGIIDWVNSPWSAKTKFPVKKNGDLRMVHAFCPINDVTIKSNYPMKRIEPILNSLSSSKYKIFWYADGANGYWAVPMWKPHAFKTAFSTVLGQFAYLRMGQGLSGAPHTYAQLKDLAMGHIPEPQAEESLTGDREDGAFHTFFDDDLGADTTFENQMRFLHERYFPRLHWARLVLNPVKSHFFMESISMLGFSADGSGLRPNDSKLKALGDYPTPRTEAELDSFIHMTTYLRKFIPGRAEHVRIMQTAIKKVPETVLDEAKRRENLDKARRWRERKQRLGQKPGWRSLGTGIPARGPPVARPFKSRMPAPGQPAPGQPVAGTAETLMSRTLAPGQPVAGTPVAETPVTGMAGAPVAGMSTKRRTVFKSVGFQWNREADISFRSVKAAILSNACHGGDPTRQYHLSCDASQYAYGGVLFQLVGEEPGAILSSPKMVDKVRLVQCISKKFLDAETRYHTTEREALAIVRCLEEVRWLVNENLHEIIVYTDHECLKTALKNTDKGRIVGWQLRLSEYDLHIVHVKGKENVLADGLSRLPADSIPYGRPGKEDSWSEAMGVSETDDRSERWKTWLEDDWYGGVAHFLVYGKLRTKDAGDGSLPVWRWWMRKIANYRLMDDDQDYPLLAYVERSGDQAWCVREREVDRALQWAHDCHGHYSADLTIKRLMGHYFWPTRHRDAVRYCRSCPSCQLTARPTPSQTPTSIVQVRPMDMMGIDGLGPISPASHGNNYILIAVDYFTRYAWAVTVPAINGSVVVKFLESIASVFGLPRSVYTDNASYFVEGQLPKFLHARGVRQFPAPKTHPSSVGLLERYVQLMLYGLRRVITGGAGGCTERWSEYVDGVLHAMNTKAVKIHRFTPAEVMLGFNPTRHRFDFTVRDHQAALDLQARHSQWDHQQDRELLRSQHESFMSCRDERLEAARQRFLDRFNRTEAGRDSGRCEAPRNGDLVLLRRAALDNRRDKKLEPRWEGPFRLNDVAHHGRSGRLFDLSTGQLVKTKVSGLKDRVHLDDLRVFVPRREGVAGMEQVSCVEMDWDGRRRLDGSVWKEVCLGGPICLGKLLAEDMREMLPRGGPLAEEKGSSCGR